MRKKKMYKISFVDHITKQHIVKEVEMRSKKEIKERYGKYDKLKIDEIKN